MHIAHVRACMCERVGVCIRSKICVYCTCVGEFNLFLLVVNLLVVNLLVVNLLIVNLLVVNY